MKRIFTLVIGMMVSLAAVAQNEMPTPEQMKQLKIERFHKRDISKQLNSKYMVPASEVTNNGSKDANGLQLPENNWFPGEWEEVKAIVVTCSYDYLVPGHESSYYWYADPIVSGYASYYQYTNNDWQEAGGGAYVAVPDTSTQAFSQVFFYLMDAIQMGGAEAWVRIENASDSSIIKRKLQRMNLRSDNLRWIVGPGNSFWFRDCGPIAFYYGDNDSVGMVDFEYYPGRALDDSLPSLIESQMGIPNYITTIEWEGGNCLVDGAGMVLSSDAIYGNNCDDSYGQITWNGTNPSSIHYTTKQRLTQKQVRDSLAHIMGPRGCHVLPAFQYDGGTGHIDLYCDMWDENEFVFSKFPDAYSNWVDYATAARNIDSLCSYTSVFGNNFKCHYIPFPCTNNGGNFSSQTIYDRNYTRTYSNHTFVNNVLIQPVFSNVVNGQPAQEWDRQRLEEVKAAYPGYTVYPINVSSFDGSGGAIHCITKQIPADSPIRILHPSITGNTESAYINSDAPINATITNNSGIASAKVVFRVEGGDWNEVTLTPGNDNSFSGSIPTTNFSSNMNEYLTVEYYIIATSNNGKTITKPMTAAQGGYYTFYLGHNPAGINDIEEQRFGQFYPNPANGLSNIGISLNGNGQYEVLFVDMTGRIVHRSTLNASGDIVYTVDTDKLSNGIYNVVFQNKSERVIRRLVVK
ncbi:MAG: agmatine deiminase family protein [Bacteroidales bacterium]|nr:agmatine deiminase family protein [Bacteroidales bacterium]